MKTFRDTGPTTVGELPHRLNAEAVAHYRAVQSIQCRPISVAEQATVTAMIDNAELVRQVDEEASRPMCLWPDSAEVEEYPIWGASMGSWLLVCVGWAVALAALAGMAVLIWWPR